MCSDVLQDASVPAKQATGVIGASLSRRCLQGLHLVEHIVVLGTSLASRLPGSPQLAAALLQQSIGGHTSPNGPVSSRLQPAPGSSISPPTDAEGLAGSANPQHPPSAGDAHAPAAGGSDEDQDDPAPAVSPGLPVAAAQRGPLNHLFITWEAQDQQPAGDCDLGVSKATEWLIGVGQRGRAPVHSLYVKAAVGELRLATTICAAY